MAYYCQQFNIWVEETIEQPVESWVNETREKCEEQECNWWVLCLNKIVCWTVVVTVKVISYVLITVPKMITVFVCELVSMPVIFIISEIQPALCFLGINFPSSNNFDLSLAIKLAKVSLTVYQEENEADFTEIDPNFEVVDFFQFQGFNFGNIYTDTQVYILKDSSTSTLIVGFRGSQPNFPDWFNDLSAIPFPYFPGSMGTLLHAGFLGAYNTIRKDLITVLLTKIAEEGIEQIYFTGHSLGGALATVASYDFKLLISQNITIKTYTYGAPKVGNVYFAYDYNGLLPETFRVVNLGDPVPELPATGGPVKYRHVKNMVYLTAPGEMSIEPCPKPIYDWTNELGKYLPPGVDLVTTYAEALITVVWSAAQGFPHHDMNEYISNLESLN